MPSDALGCPWCHGTLLLSFAKAQESAGDCEGEAYHCTSGPNCAGYHAVPHDTSLSFSGIDRRELVRRFFDAFHRHVRLTGCCERLRGARRTKRVCIETPHGARVGGGPQGEAGEPATPMHSIRARQSPLFDPIDASDCGGDDILLPAHVQGSSSEAASAHNTLMFYFLECALHGSSDFIV